METSHSTPISSSEYSECLDYLENSWIQLRKCNNADSFFKKLFTLDFFGYTQEFTLKVNSLSSTQNRFKRAGFSEATLDRIVNSSPNKPINTEADIAQLNSQHIYPVFILDFYELLISQYELLGEIQRSDCIQNINKISDLFKAIEKSNNHLNCGFDKDQAEYVLMNLESLSGSIEPDFRDNTAFLNQEIENKPNDVIGLDELNQNATLMLEMFPSSSVENLKELLISCNNDLELAISKRLDGDNSNAEPEKKQLKSNIPSESSIESIKMKEMEEYLKKRRNIFDNDELDIFNSNEIDESKILNGTIKSPKKYDLNSALKGVDNERVLAAALLLEEDEYDDTLEDNYGINLGLSGSESESEGEGEGEGESKDKNQKSRHNNSNSESTDIRDLDSLLGKLAISDPSVFSKSSIIRRSAARQKLIEETNLSNEQIEGWYTMLNRDPSRKAKLEKAVLVQSRNNHLESKTENSTKEPSGSKNSNNPNNSSSKYKGKHNRRANSNKKFNQSFGFSQEK
ncbi:hypothetical protein AYI70_g645 [Smittium culicis]|uniref:CUE domain-containing protein n=1 Tax=Smittium culicis TaxID=133412 RepID=A0A1R1YFW6_9FUNG|nr:hypothetical protein AYI70_g645 [Smittium culicis]